MSILLLTLAAASATATPPIERRCGWLHNPTPANWWLIDRDGQWVFSSQGRPSVAGWEDLASEPAREWVKTNGSYGYGCACATVRVDRKRGNVVEIRRLTPRPIKACRADRRLPKP